MQIMAAVAFSRSGMIIFLLALWLVVLSGGSLLAAELEKVRVGLSSISATHGALWVAEEKGLFKKYGLDPEVIVIGGGGARGVSALIAGDIQFVTAAGDSVISAALRGADAVMIAGILNKGVQRIMTPAGDEDAGRSDRQKSRGYALWRRIAPGTVDDAQEMGNQPRQGSGAPGRVVIGHGRES